MTENLQEKLKFKRFKKIKRCQNAPKLFAKYLEDKIWKTKQHFSKPEDIFKSAKKFLEKLNTKEGSSKTTISKFLSKISNRKKTSKQ